MDFFLPKVLQYYFGVWKLLGIIPSSYRKGFSPPTASAKSIPSSGNSVRIPSADTLPGEQVDLWHHYLILFHPPSQADWCLRVLPGAPSPGWTHSSYAPPLYISIIQRGSEHCYNAEKLIMFISASCWGPLAEGDLVRIEQHNIKWNLETKGRISKHTGSLRPSYRYIHAERDINIYSVSYTHTHTHTHKYHINILYQEMHTSHLLACTQTAPMGKAIVFCWELIRAKEAFYQCYQFIKKNKETTELNIDVANKSKWCLSYLYKIIRQIWI